MLSRVLALLPMLMSVETPKRSHGWKVSVSIPDREVRFSSVIENIREWPVEEFSISVLKARDWVGITLMLYEIRLSGREGLLVGANRGVNGGTVELGRYILSTLA